MTPIPFLLHFHVTISSKNYNFSTFSRFFTRSIGKILFFKNFLPTPNFYWRHKELQNSHSGYLQPLLASLETISNLKCSQLFVYVVYIKAMMLLCIKIFKAYFLKISLFFQRNTSCNINKNIDQKFMSFFIIIDFKINQQYLFYFDR